VLTPPDNSDHSILMLADLYEDHGLTNLADEIRSEVLGGTQHNQWGHTHSSIGHASVVGGLGTADLVGGLGTGVGVGGTRIGVGAGGASIGVGVGGASSVVGGDN
jgi:hypothetical protein